MKQFIIAVILLIVFGFGLDYICPVCKKTIWIDTLSGKTYEISGKTTNLINTNITKIAFIGANLIEGRKFPIYFHHLCNTNNTATKIVITTATNFIKTNVKAIASKEIVK